MWTVTDGRLCAGAGEANLQTRRSSPQAPSLALERALRADACERPPRVQGQTPVRARRGGLSTQGTSVCREEGSPGPGLEVPRERGQEVVGTRGHTGQPRRRGAGAEQRPQH